MGTKSRTSHHRSPGGERCRKSKHSMTFLERKRKGHRQSDQHWHCFKGNIGETHEMGCSTYGLSWAHRYHLELNWTGTQACLYFDLIWSTYIICTSIFFPQIQLEYTKYTVHVLKQIPDDQMPNNWMVRVTHIRPWHCLPFVHSSLVNRYMIRSCCAGLPN